MKKSKLFLLLKTLDRSEMEAFGQFLASPFFNRDSQLIDLFTALKTYHPEYGGSGVPKKEEISETIFPGSTYQEKQFGYLLSDLNKLAEEFLAIQHFRSQPVDPGFYLLEELSARRLTKAYRQAIRQLKKKLEHFPEQDSSLFLHKFRLEELKEKHFRRSHRREKDLTIQQVAASLDRYYFLRRLVLSCGMLDRQAILKSDYQINLSHDWVQHLKDKDFFGEPLIRIYYTIYQALIQEGKEVHFIRLKEYISQYQELLPATDIKDVLLFAINYCARKIRQGKDQYISEALQLYLAGIESEALLENGHLSPWTFTNVVKLLLRLEQFDRIEPFIRQYAPMLPAEFRENALHYNLAELYYYTQQFEKAQTELVQVAYSDLNYYLGARVLLAKIYYEQGEEEALLSLIASFTIFLKRNKDISANIKQTYLNFCNLLFKIVRRSLRNWAELAIEIAEVPLLTDRSWLQRIYEQSAPPPGQVK